MKDNNYVTKMGWMYNHLNLNPTQAEIYAIIFGFSQDGRSVFRGSLKYLSDSLNVSRNTVISTLKFLQKHDLITKKKIMVKGVFYSEYSVNLLKKVGSANSGLLVQNLVGGSANSALGGSANSAPYITNIHNNIYNKENFLINWNESRKFYLKIASNLNRLYLDEETDFNDNLEKYSKEEWQTALTGLFKQKSVPQQVMLFRPKHFLKNIDQYLDAEKNKKYDLYV